MKISTMSCLLSRTFDYVRREIVNVPSHIPILVISNHRDMGHHRLVSDDDVRFFIDALERLALINLFVYIICDCELIAIYHP